MSSLVLLNDRVTSSYWVPGVSEEDAPWMDSATGGTNTATCSSSSDVVGLSHDQDRETTPLHEKRDGPDAKDTWYASWLYLCLHTHQRGVNLLKPVVCPVGIMSDTPESGKRRERDWGTPELLLIKYRECIYEQQAQEWEISTDSAPHCNTIVRWFNRLSSTPFKCQLQVMGVKGPQPATETLGSCHGLADDIWTSRGNHMWQVGNKTASFENKGLVLTPLSCSADS